MIQKNGLQNGGKIVLGYLGNYGRSFFVGSGDILLITGGIGDKAHYRAFGVAEELKIHGFQTAVTVADNFRLIKYADKFQIFVFHKVSYSERIKLLIDKIKAQNKEIIFDTDDLDFDPQYLKDMDYFQNITETEKGEYEKGIGMEILKNSYVKTCTTTVDYLADKLREYDKQVFVVANKISNTELKLTDEIIKKEKKSDGYVRIGYYSGTPSHDKDFATVTPALVDILEKYEKVKIILAGLLNITDEMKKYSDRMEKLPRVPRKEYYSNIYKCDINIVPLEMGNPFCESRSELKFMEAGILGIPTVAVLNHTYSETISDGVDGFLAGNTSEWIDKISRLIEDENFRKSIGQKAREKVLRDYTNKNSHSEEYYNYLKDRLRK